MGEGGGGGDHFLAEGFVKEVDGEFAGFADVAGGVFWGVFVFISGGEGDDGGIGAEDVEEGVGGGVEVALGV